MAHLLYWRRMKVKSTIWDLTTRLAIGLILLAGGLFVYYWYRPLIEQNRRYRREIFDLEQKIQAEERLARYYREAIEATTKDPVTVTRQIREGLGRAKTNETVIRFEGPGPP